VVVAFRPAADLSLSGDLRAIERAVARIDRRLAAQ
jgi:hypothetical protein